MTDKIVIIGASDNVFAFKGIGMEAIKIVEAESAKDKIKVLSKTAKLIYIDEILAVELKEFLSNFSSKPYPIIVPLPISKSIGFGMESVKRDMEKAIGADILFKD